MLQIKCKYLALSLSQLDASGRAEMIDKVKSEGLDAAMAYRAPEIMRDLRARQAKMLFMRRRAQADELGALIDRAYGRTTKWQAILTLASATAALPIDQDKIIERTRKFKKRYLGAGI